MGYWEEVLVSGKDAGAGTNSWIVVDSWGGGKSWIGAEHISWAKTSPPGGTAAMVIILLTACFRYLHLLAASPAANTVSEATRGHW